MPARSFRKLLRLVLPVLGGMIVLAGCVSFQPVHDIANHGVPPIAVRLGTEGIGQTIQLSASQQGWLTVMPRQGELRLHKDDGERYAEAVLRYHANGYSITYTGSNMLRPNSDIEVDYNHWVSALVTDIDQRLTQMGVAQAGLPHAAGQ